MNFDPIILTLIIATPLVGAILLALIPEREGTRTHAIGALAITLFTLVLTLHLPSHFNYHAAPRTFQFEQNLSWIPSPNIRYHLGVDGLSMWLIVLAAFLAPIGVLASWNTIKSRTRLFFTLFLLFIRFVPIVNMSELKATLPGSQPSHNTTGGGEH